MRTYIQVADGGLCCMAKVKVENLQVGDIVLDAKEIKCEICN